MCHACVYLRFVAGGITPTAWKIGGETVLLLMQGAGAARNVNIRASGAWWKQSSSTSDTRPSLRPKLLERVPVHLPLARAHVSRASGLRGEDPEVAAARWRSLRHSPQALRAPRREMCSSRLTLYWRNCCPSAVFPRFVFYILVFVRAMYL